jgi:archaellum component FlaC
MDSVTIFVLSLCIIHSQANTLTDLHNDFKEIKNEVQDLKEHVKKLETLTHVLTRGHIRRKI